MVDLEAMKAELNAVGWAVSIERTSTASGQGTRKYAVLSCPEGKKSLIVYEDRFVVSLHAEVNRFLPILDIIRRHVAPAEPVTLTAEESADLDDLLHKWLPFTDRIPQPSQMVETWLRERGFRLVRTGGADGA